MRRAIGLLAATLTLAPAGLQTPVFRSRVDLVTVDVSVVDSDGRPVTRLSAPDFSIVAAKRARRVVSADYIAAVESRAAPGPAIGAIAPLPGPTSNSAPTTGRSFLFVIDVENIGQGGNRNALTSLGAYLGRLGPEDRVGLIALPYRAPRVDLTTDRRDLIAALENIVGASARDQGMTMTVGEAGAIELLDQDVLAQYLERINKACTDPLPGLPGIEDDPTLSCIQRFQPVAARVMDAERRHTHYLFATLRELADAMASIDGPKAMVLVSQGIVNDRFTLDHQRQFAQAAARARVTLFAINLVAPLPGVVSQYNMTSAHIRDHQLRLDGMARLAIAGRGDVYVVSGTPDNALARIDAEMAGYYLLSFERDAADRSGERAGIEVKVNWPNARVRARPEFTLDTPLGAPPLRLSAEPLEAISDLLRWPMPGTNLGMDVDTYTAPSPDGAAGLRTVVAASIASGGQPVTAVGYEVINDTGAIVAGGIEPKAGGNARAAPTPTIDTQSVAADRRLYTTAFAIPEGRYRLKLAAIDAGGRHGSVSHHFDVRSARAGALRLGDVFIGELSPAGFLPNPSVPPNAAALPVRVDIAGDTPGDLSGASVRMELARPGAPAFAQTPLSMSTPPTGDGRRRTASATLSLAALPRGSYLVTAVLTAADGTSARTSRLFFRR
jgi:VWFA-related protein